MMDLDANHAMEMRGQNDTEATGTSLITDDGVRSKEGILMAQMGKKQQLNV